MTVTVNELQLTMDAGDLADCAGIDPNAEPGNRSMFIARAEEMLRLYYTRGGADAVAEVEQIIRGDR